MRSSSRRDAIRLSVFGVLPFIVAMTCPAQQKAPIAQQVAKTYGFDSYGQIDGIRWTWNGQLFGLNISHKWEWNPKTGTVSYEGRDKDGKPIKVTYQQSQLSSQSDVIKNQVQPAFINDQYWLLVVFHAVWDGSATVMDDGMQKLPEGNGSAERMVMKYPAEAGGYTPGDTWTFYIGPDKRVEVLEYRRGGAKKPKIVIAKWTDYKKAGPLLVAMDHRGTADGKPLRIWFTDVAVKVTGSQNWMSAQ